jgi:hypothetical protein
VAGKSLGQRPTWFSALLLLDAFALGGLVVWRVVLNLLDSMMDDSVRREALGEIPHILDQLLPYWLGHTGLFLLLALITAGAYLWLRARSANVGLVQ